MTMSPFEGVEKPKDAAVLKGFREAHLRAMKTLKGWLQA
jgi:hypothetical protein